VAAIALALTAGLAWGAADFVGGLKSRKLPLLTVMVLSQVAGLALIAAIVAARAKGPPDAGSLALAALSALAGLGGLAAFYRGLAVGAMAIVAPISGTAAGVPVLVGLATGERPSAVQVVGIVLALAGVVLASREEVPGEEGRSTRTAAGAGLAVAAALGFGCFFVIIDKASDADALWAILANRVAGVTLLGTLALALRPSVAVAGPDARALAAVGLLDVTANTLYAVAATEGLVSLVAVLASLYPVVVVLLAHLILGERVRPSQQLGVAAALGGVGLIVSG
jgi:drug/metabolite transporter (DMT)-like permease